MDISHVPLGRSLMDELNNKVFKSRSAAAHPSCQPETGGLEISGASRSPPRLQRTRSLGSELPLEPRFHHAAT